MRTNATQPEVASKTAASHVQCHDYFLLPVEVMAVLFSASSNLVSMLTHAPLHLAWWHSAQTSRTLLNVKVIRQGHMGFCASFLRTWYCLNQLAWIHEMPFARLRHFGTVHRSNWGYLRAVLSLEQEQGLTILSTLIRHSIDVFLFVCRQTDAV